MKKYVYFIEAVGTNRVKIGFSSDPYLRLQQIRTCSPFPVRLLAVIEGSVDLERAFHSQYDHKRIHGEWFIVGDDEIEEIIKLNSDQEKCIDYVFDALTSLN